MLVEVLNVRQVEGERYRRWFCGEHLELIVWYEADRTIYGFQLCYNQDGKERALTWQHGALFTHKKVDDGEHGSMGLKMSPALFPDGPVPLPAVLSLFTAQSRNLDAGLAEFVLERLTGLAHATPEKEMS